MINLALNYLHSISLTPLTFLMLAFLIALAGFVDSIAGGGGLISLPAYMIVGLPAKIGSGTNKLSACCGAGMSFYRYAKAGYVNPKLAIPCVVAGMVGSGFGAALLNKVDEDVFKIMIAIVLPLVLVFVLRKKTLSDTSAVAEIHRGTVTKCFFGSFIIGIYDGFYGPGTGVFLLILFTSVCKLKLTDANGVAKTINFATNLTAAFAHIINGNALIPLAIVCGICSAIGSFFGTSLFKDKGARIVKPIMIIVLLLFIVKVIVELIQKFRG